MASSSSDSSSATADRIQAIHARGSREAGKPLVARAERDRVQHHGDEHDCEPGGRPQNAGDDHQAHDGHGDCHDAAQDDHLAVQADTAGDDRAQAEQGRQIEDIGPDDDTGAQPLLMTGDRGDGRGDLRCVGRQRRHYPE